MWNVLFLFGGLIYISLLIFVFHFKERINSVENKIFKIVSLVTLLTFICEIFLQFSIRESWLKGTLGIYLGKVYLICVLLWFAIFSIYTFVILNKKISNEEFIKSKLFYLIIYSNIIFFVSYSIIVLIFPLEIFYKGEHMYSYGLATDILKIGLGIYLVIWIIQLIINIKEILNKKYYPIIGAIVLILLNLILQVYYPQILLATFTMGFVSYLMFFTIENPDVRMIEQLNMAKSEAERANMAKSDFLASMSHEIRTPLNAITGFSHAILNDETLSSESLEYANDIVKASNTLLEIVGGVLDVSKIESNKMDIVEVLYNPREEIEDLVKIVNARLGEKPVVFNYKVAEDLPYQLYGDRANMKKVVTNLLTNAVKYTAKGQIFFNVRCINKNDICHVVISVQDTGMGIKEEHISKLFTKFERLEVEKNTTAEGTGLGLAITKRLVELMGGKINVKSQYGVGSIFMTQIPQRIAMMSKPLTDTQILSTVELKNKRLKEEANIDGQRILIVDDNALNIKVAKIALKNFNLVLDEVESGEECLEKIKSGERYDLILMDIMMPGLSGEETFIELKKIVGFNTPVIALTADAVSGSKEKYLSQGFTSYISKPFSPEEIKLELAKIFKTKR